MHPEICTAEKVCSSYFMQLAFSPRQNSRCKLSHLVIRQPGITGNGRERQTALLQQAGGNLLFGVSVAVVIALKKCIVAGAASGAGGASVVSGSLKSSS